MLLPERKLETVLPALGRQVRLVKQLPGKLDPKVKVCNFTRVIDRIEVSRVIAASLAFAMTQHIS